MAKKIVAIVSLSIIGVLILATIIMANINVNYGVNCATPTSVWVNYNSNNPNNERKVANADAVVEFINNASKEKSLTALFNGTLGKKPNIVATSSKNLPSNSDFYVRFRYENGPQKLMDGKKEYKDSNGNNVYYNDLVFTVKNVSGINLVNVYVITDSSNSKVYNYYYELEANFEGLYDFLVENNYNS